MKALKAVGWVILVIASAGLWPCRPRYFFTLIALYVCAVATVSFYFAAVH